MEQTAPSALALVCALLGAACASSAGSNAPDGDDDDLAFPDSGLGGGLADASLPPENADANVQLVGDSCTAPELLTLAAGGITLAGSTSGALRDHAAPPSCNVPAAHLDRVYQVEVAAKQTLQVQLAGSAPSSATVSIQRACPDTSLIGGCTVGTPSLGFTASRDYDEAGTAYVFVWAGPDVDYSLDLDLLPLP